MSATVMARNGSDSALRNLLSTATHRTAQSLGERFDHPCNPFDRLPYHGSSHSLRVADDAREALQLIRRHAPETNAQPHLGALAGLFHDTVQQAVIPGWKLGVINLDDYPSRPRASTNEARSAEVAESWLKSYQRNAAGLPLLSAGDLETITEAIVATVVSFQDGVVIHPNLTPKSSLTARVLAVADVSRAGRHGPIAWRDDTIRLAVESDLMLLRATLADSPLPEATAELLKRRILTHISSSLMFVANRHWQLEDELIVWLPEAAQQPLREFFGGQTSAVLDYAADWLDQCATMSSTTLLQEFSLIS